MSLIVRQRGTPDSRWAALRKGGCCGLHFFTLRDEKVTTKEQDRASKQVKAKA